MSIVARCVVLCLAVATTCAMATAAAPKSKTARPTTFPDPKLAKERVISPEAEVKTYQAQPPGMHANPEFAVYVPKSYSAETPMPLVISSHGAGSSGPKEINAWVKLAEQYGFIVVCPSYGIAAESILKLAGGLKLANPEVVAKEEMMMAGILDRVLRSLNVDRDFVLHTGFSGGGFPTTLVGMKHPEIFTALCYRSGNFCGPMVPIDKRAWVNRPVYIFWGTNDNPIIVTKGPAGFAEGPASLAFFKQLGNTRLKYEIIEGGGHDSHPEKAAQWFAEQVVTPGREAMQKAKKRP